MRIDQAHGHVPVDASSRHQNTLFAAFRASAGISIFSLSAIFLLITSSARGHQHLDARPSRPPASRFTSSPACSPMEAKSGPLLTSAPSPPGRRRSVDGLARLQGLAEDEAPRLVAQEHRVGRDPERVHRLRRPEQRAQGLRGRPVGGHRPRDQGQAHDGRPPSAPPAPAGPRCSGCRSRRCARRAGSPGGRRPAGS